MPRGPRLRLPGLPLHIVHRGNNRGLCFFREAHFGRYLERLQESATRFDCRVHAYVLMTNHVHLLVTPRDPQGISALMKRIAQDHAQYINRTCSRSGPFWEGRYYASFVDSETYFLRCHKYIEMNPVRAGLVHHPAEYRWSSFRTNALGYPSAFLSNHEVYEGLGSSPPRRQAAYRAFFEVPLTGDELECIRAATRSGRAVGSVEFLERVKAQANRPVIVAARGRPASTSEEKGTVPI